MMPITSGPAREFGPVLSPDGKWVAYVSNAGGSQNVWVKFLAGGDPVNLTATSGLDISGSSAIGGLEVSPDGSRIAVMARPRGSTSTFATFEIPAPLPGARSVGAILATAPAVLMTRHDVAGNTALAPGPWSAYGVAGYSRPTLDGISVANLNPFGLTLDYGSFDHVWLGLGLLDVSSLDRLSVSSPDLWVVRRRAFVPIVAESRRATRTAVSGASGTPPEAMPGKATSDGKD